MSEIKKLYTETFQVDNQHLPGFGSSCFITVMAEYFKTWKIGRVTVHDSLDNCFVDEKLNECVRYDQLDVEASDVIRHAISIFDQAKAKFGIKE